MSSHPQQAIDHREIRIFFSSTFRDMQAERDELISRVSPQLRLSSGAI